MSDAFAKALPRILVYEGGKVDDPQDPGGRTNKGITQATYNSFRREQGLVAKDVYTISNEEVATIYKTKYWDAVEGDKLPIGLDLVVFDGAVNSGCGQSGKWLQKALGDHYAGAIDGRLGAKTLQAIEDYNDNPALIEAYCSRRLGTLKRLRTYSRFGKGWAARIANGQKTALAWSDASEAPHPVSLMDVGGHMKAPVTDNLKDPPVSQIATHIATAATSTGTIASQAATQVQVVSDTFGWVKYVFGALTLLAVVAGVLVKISADAKDAAEKGTATAAVNIDADAGLPTVAVDDKAPAAVAFVTVPVQPAPAAPAKGA